MIASPDQCYFHGEEVVLKGSYVCFECGHVWKTAGEIVEAHLSELEAISAVNETNLEPGAAKKAALRFCPLCLHDWPPR